ncbi:rod shape-determining protein MreC [Duganella zoogloeoides]|uniref:Cell shape-determining protein MreC n=1 Tax=Duganella zoogloeoides TaxID=75659 RepID=A0ABZ0XZX6_9BURK|nr:rod shape-determining protein MreC [Duganella zoogloeoides]WQH05151.1 rod shape-determining protein MreC [Duganella zoogloeoides]
MEYSPPPLFKQGASARVKMTVFACISIVLLLVDSQMRTLGTVRQVVGTVLHPLQMVALLPRDAIYGAGDYFSSLAEMKKQVDELKRQQIADAQALQQAQLRTAENNQLRRLMGAREQVPTKSMLAEVLYDARDASSRKIILNRGSNSDVSLGLPVIDNQGVVGQVTRVFPFTSEVTLLTDKDQAIPVQLLRNGLRSVAYGRGKIGSLELRFTAPNADIKVGDIVVTSGLDGIYPAGLAVARVTQVDSNANGAFGGVICQPLAGIQNNRQLLILMSPPEIAPRPPDEEPRVPRKGNNRMAPIKDPVKEEAPAAGAAPAAGTAAATGSDLIPKAPAATPPAAAPATGAPTAATPVATPAGGTPTAATPATRVPAIGTPTAATPTTRAPATGAPAAGTPAVTPPAARTPATVPANRAPATGAPAAGAPAATPTKEPAR